MTKARWAEWLTPYTAGMGLALLVVAIVVRPALAADCVRPMGMCGQCIEAHRYRAANDKSICNYSGYYQQSCITRYADSKCYPDPCACSHDGQSMPMPDCGSMGCNFYAEDETFQPYYKLCSWKCWNRFCSQTNEEARCLDTQRKCTPQETSGKCWDCKCR